MTIIVAGDRIWGFDETAQEMRNAYDRYRALAETTGVPFYSVPGNHECQSDSAAIELLVHLDRERLGVEVIDPGRMQIDYVAGDDGLEPVTTTRVMNTTDRKLLARNLELRVPMLSSPDLYRLSTDYVEFDGTQIELDATARKIVDNGDGSVTLSVEVPVPDGSAFCVTAEPREPR